MVRSVFSGLENIGEKGRKYHFLLFPKFFDKLSFSGSLKVGIVCKGLKLDCVVKDEIFFMHTLCMEISLQLIIECKDVLAKAVLVKQDYQWMVQAVLEDFEANAENSPLDLELFDDDMSSMFKVILIFTFCL